MRTYTWLPLAALGIALAQGPMGPGRLFRPFGAPGAAAPAPRFDELKAYLNLTDSQVQAIQQARENAMGSLAAVVEQIHSKQQALHELLDRGTSDAAAVGKLLLEIRALERQIEQARAAIRSQLLGLLTADQKTKLAALEQAAKLWPLIQQGTMLGLLEPPAPGPGGLIGPRGFGFGHMQQRPGAGMLAPRRPMRAML